LVNEARRGLINSFNSEIALYGTKYNKPEWVMQGNALEQNQNQVGYQSDTVNKEMMESFTDQPGNYWDLDTSTENSSEETFMDGL